MHKQRHGYLLGLGCNIDPFENFSSMVALLLAHFERFDISRILHIPPVGMNSQHFFLNAVAFIETDMPQDNLKDICNAIEMRLGRDREDPDRKHKDRPADLDILCSLTVPDGLNTPAREVTDEYFLYPLIDELFKFLSDQPLNSQIQNGTKIQVGSLSFGESATTIHRN